MPFIGNQPAEAYSSFQKQDFTTSATTSYTLDHPVANQNEIALFINFVRQEPTAAYTASGTSLTLTSATSSSDDMYCVYLGKAVQTVNPPSGSVGISQLSATGTKDATTFLRGDNTFASAGGQNTPNFFLNASASHDISNATSTIVQYNTAVYDTDSATGSNGFTVPSGKGGKYYIFARLMGQFWDASGEYADLSIFEGSTKKITQRSGGYNAGGDRNTTEITGVVNVSAGSLLTVRLYHTMGSARGFDTDTLYTYFGGYKIIE